MAGGEARCGRRSSLVVIWKAANFTNSAHTPFLGSLLPSQVAPTAYLQPFCPDPLAGPSLQKLPWPAHTHTNSLVSFCRLQVVHRVSSSLLGPLPSFRALSGRLKSLRSDVIGSIKILSPRQKLQGATEKLLKGYSLNTPEASEAVRVKHRSKIERSGVIRKAGVRETCLDYRGTSLTRTPPPKDFHRALGVVLQ